MSIEIKFIPLSFINSNDEILRQIKNTVVFSFLFNQFEETTLDYYIESTQYGYTASANNSGTHRLLRITDINYGKVNWDNVPFCNCDSEDKYLLKDNDILIARTGGTTGKSFVVSNAPANAIFASYLIRLRLKNQVDIDFINYFLNSYIFWSQIIEMKSGSAMPNVNAEKLKTLKLPKCDIKTQNKIVLALKKGDYQLDFSYLFQKMVSIEDVFNNGNSISAELAHQLDLVKKLRQQLLQDAVRGKLLSQNPKDEPASELLKKIKAEKEKLIKEGKLKKEKPLLPIKDEEIPFDIPENWVWCRLGEVAQVKRGIGPKYSEVGNKIILNQKCIRWFTVNIEFAKRVDNAWFNNLDQDYLTMQYDVLINSTGEGTIGRAAIVDSSALQIPFDSHILRVRTRINSKYICLIINSSFGQNQIEGLKGAKSTKQTELGVGNLNNFLIPIPPLSEQHRIVQKIEQLMQVCNELEKNIKQNQIYTEKLLQVALKEALEPKEVSELVEV